MGHEEMAAVAAVGEKDDAFMSDEKINLDLLGSRVQTLTAEVRDLQQRFSAMESRFSAMEVRIGSLERRFAVQEERMSAMLALIVRIAERVGASTPGTDGG